MYLPWMFRSLFLASLLFFLISSPTLAQSPPFFEPLEGQQIAEDAGVSRGTAWGDFDNDGDPDLYVANAGGQQNFFYENQGDGQLRKVTEVGGGTMAETVKYGGDSQGVNWVDVDDDGWLDLYVVSRGLEPNFLFRNEEGQGFERILEGPLVEDTVSASMSCWVDFDGDGDLDVFMAGYRHNGDRAYENQGGGAFIRRDDVMLTGGEGRARACGCADADGDGLPEVYIANARQPNVYYKNLGGWEFGKINGGHVTDDIGYSYGISWADVDDDGDLDLFVANFDKENHLYINDGNGALAPVLDSPLAAQIGGASKGHAWGDYDLDGDLDLYIGNGTYGPDMQNFLFLNEGAGQFQRILDDVLMADADTSAGVTQGDFDRDGDLDLFVANWGGDEEINKLYVNQTNREGWVTFRLKQQGVNPFAIGARVTLEVSDGQESRTMYRWVYPVTGYGSQNDYAVHFGLGRFNRITSVKVEWPSKELTEISSIAPNQHYWLTGEGILEVID